jgi:uncharacterized protein with PQ loop repeat
MIILNILASILWLTYGIILDKPPIYISNIIYFIANITITIMKIKYKNKSSPNPISSTINNNELSQENNI